jgi:SAM-dependent methyltransferase
MNEVNAEYWRTRDGKKYLSQQAQRSSVGNNMYAQQETWLVQYLSDIAKRLDRPVRVLEFGCGFGRFAQIFAASADVVYHGYDFSLPMVQPLLDALPEGLPAERIRVAPTVGEAFPDEHFDCIFTVSVLIHNAPENARRLVDTMLSMLGDKGSLCLMENQLASFSMRENNWHGGCWVHDHVGPYADRMDVTVLRGVVDAQDIYVFKQPDEAKASISLVRDGLSEKVSLEYLRQLGMARVESAVRGLESEVANFAAQQAEAHDAREDLNDLKKQFDQVQGELQVSQSERSSLREVQGLRQRLELALRAHDSLGVGGDLYEAEASDEFHLFAPTEASIHEFEWNQPRDTEFAHSSEVFTPVCHVFHMEWFGIRAAAGSLPGHKLGISADRPLSAASIERIIALLKGHKVSRLVMHGFSPAMEGFIRAMKAAGFDQLYLVWHGAAAMWVFEGERQLAQSALRLVHRGIIRRMQGMRRGMDGIIGPRAFSPQLLNVVPNLASSSLKKAGKPSQIIVFSPSWNLLHKNLITNLLAAQVNPEVTEFWSMAKDLSLGRGLSTKLKVLSPRHGRDMLETMRQADIVANVSIIDCHPMVDQEALAVGTPCLRGPLFLDALEDHAYVRATQVTNPLSIDDISDTISRVLHIGRSEMAGMMADYALEVRKISFARYAEFLELN